MAHPSGHSQHRCTFPKFWARRERAEKRQAERAKRTDEEQVKLLQSRPGNSEREIAKLKAQIEKGQ